MKFYKKLIVVFVIIIGSTACDKDDEAPSLEEVSRLIIGTWKTNHPDVGEATYTFSSDSVATLVTEKRTTHALYWVQAPAADMTKVVATVVFFGGSSDYAYGITNHIQKLTNTTMHLSEYCEGTECLPALIFQKQ